MRTAREWNSRSIHVLICSALAHTAHQRWRKEYKKQSSQKTALPPVSFSKKGFDNRKLIASYITLLFWINLKRMTLKKIGNKSYQIIISKLGVLWIPGVLNHVKNLQRPDEEPLLLSAILTQSVKALVPLKEGHTIFSKPWLHEVFLLSFSIHFCMTAIFVDSRPKHSNVTIPDLPKSFWVRIG